MVRIAPFAQSHKAACARMFRDAFGGSVGRIARFAFVAMEGRSVIGWIGAMPQYDGRVWEIHPLVVAEEHHGRGVGSALLARIEREVRARGAITLWAGSDDEHNQTTLGGADLYPDIPGAIRNIRNLGRHPYEFYLKAGFKIVGVMPDANGFGKPDIFLAKRVGLDPKKEPATKNVAG